MQPIQDKDFDKLFKDSLHDVEIAPSAGLWSAIEAEITPKKRALSLRYWLVAASIVLLATVTLVIYNQQKIAPSPSLVNVAPAIKKGKIEKQILPKIEETNANLVKTDLAVEPVSKSSYVGLKNERRKLQAKTIPEISSKKMVELPLLAENNNLPKTGAPEAEEIILATSVAPSQQNMVLASVQSVHQEKSIVDENVTASKGIKNAGDLINLVLNTVDKSKNKFIRFKTNDEGSTLAAVNIGPFRFGKQSD
ncbi:hypothetical protein ABIB40_001640 [Pedobacter sp. UYP30]|uniref:hypothetical protein n=1 Tax=Pedobacter sp. UYP30 TaxID=1756400 RepID=UPI0033960EA1